MILSATPMGEYDKRVVILTKECGKISAFARAARRPNSPLVGVTNPFCFGEFYLYEGRTSYTVVRADISQYFAEIGKDLEKTCYGSYFLELADYYTREYNDEVLMLKLLYQTLRALSSDKIPSVLIRSVYELKTLAVNGECPDVTKLQGKISKAALYAMQYVIATPIEKLYTFAVSKEVQEELAGQMKVYMRTYVDRDFKSLSVLEMCLI